MKHLKFDKNDNIFIMSDPHFGHKNICIGSTKWTGDSLKGCRKFKDQFEMDEIVLNNINNKVGINDHLICLGDWSFGGNQNIANYRNRIICKNIHLVLGNHDKDIRESVIHQSNFTTVRDYLEITVDDIHVIMSHYPINSWNRMHRGSLHLHGHQHLPLNLKNSKGRRLDVGLDGNNMKIYSFNEIYNLLKDKEILTDHHNIS